MITPFLDPITSDLPCGENLAYDPVFLDLQNKVRGREETQFSAAEDPDWKELVELATGLTERFKHLQVGVILTLALLQTQGLSGFRDGLKILCGWLDKYWDTLHPQLDPEDNHDPTERINILQCLSVTAPGDPYRFCSRLAQIPLCESKTLGRYALAAIKDGPAAGTQSAGGKPGLDPAQVAAAFRDTPSDLLQNQFQTLSETLGALKEMDVLFGQWAGEGRGPNFESLKKTLQEMRGLVAPYVAEPESGARNMLAPESSPAQNPDKAAATVNPGYQKTIESREDVLAALGAVCDYYQRREPSSPVPFLLQRAQRLVKMDFLQIVGDLAPEALAQMKSITGTTESPGTKS